MDTISSNFVVGGALPPASPTYVERSADVELFNSILAGQFCYVFAPHHMGKSSLMLRTDWRLQQQGFSTTTVDFSGLGSEVDVAQLYLLLLKRLKFQLKLSPDPDLWWAERVSLDATHRFTTFLRDVVLDEGVDGLVERLFHLPAAQNELDLQFVKDGLRANPHWRQSLSLYRRVYEGQRIPYDEQLPDQNRLKLLGLVRVENGFLQVRNEIYRLVFNLD